jgi:hypothetical protein
MTNDFTQAVSLISLSAVRHPRALPLNLELFLAAAGAPIPASSRPSCSGVEHVLARPFNVSFVRVGRERDQLLLGKKRPLSRSRS